MKVGFTGTRRGMTNAQHKAFIDLMWLLKPAAFLHGACVGADTEAARSVEVMGHAPVYIVAYPGVSAGNGSDECRSQAALDASALVMLPKSHFARNRDIVKACEILVATPKDAIRPKRGTGGGTWYTVEYAEKTGIPVKIIWPDGKVA